MYIQQFKKPIFSDISVGDFGFFFFFFEIFRCTCPRPGGLCPKRGLYDIFNVVFCDAVWDHIMLSKFNFLNHDVTNFRPHTQEIEMRIGRYIFGIVQISYRMPCIAYKQHNDVFPLTNITTQT